uniref:sulfotransferase n=1 Tax=Synechococcus sp. UW106 TaxID=368495 RepID=UPI000E0F1737|nr:sulfotransferase [Synechococcus sp. UW106]
MRGKIIQIGFNKTGTSSLARFFSNNGFKVVGHSRYANKIINNIHQDQPPFQGLDFDVAQDLEDHKNNLYIQDYYKEIDQSHPETKFILTTRSCEKWIESRLNHNAGRYARRAMRNHGITELNELIHRWREQFYQYHLDVTRYFKDSNNFYILPLEKIDAQGLIDFLGSDFKFSKTNYPTVQIKKIKDVPQYDLSIPD